MKPVCRLVCLAALALAVAGCSYGYAAPYTRYGTGPEITVASPSSQGVRYSSQGVR
jgi:PBP1b-binding outer membrane lipoprotein LpoB